MYRENTLTYVKYMIFQGIKNTTFWMTSYLFHWNVGWLKYRLYFQTMPMLKRRHLFMLEIVFITKKASKGYTLQCMHMLKIHINTNYKQHIHFNSYIIFLSIWFFKNLLFLLRMYTNCDIQWFLSYTDKIVGKIIPKCSDGSGCKAI